MYRKSGGERHLKRTNLALSPLGYFCPEEEVSGSDSRRSPKPPLEVSRAVIGAVPFSVLLRFFYLQDKYVFARLTPCVAHLRAKQITSKAFLLAQHLAVPDFQEVVARQAIQQRFASLE